MRQEKNLDFRTFSHKTDELSLVLGVNLKELPAILGFSLRMLNGYRSGDYPITEKAWLKLEKAERAAGISKTPQDSEILDDRAQEESGNYETAQIIENQEITSNGEEFTIKDISIRLGRMEILNQEMFEMMKQFSEKINSL